jgi:predicted metal-dependent phosphoesterase TrpH
LSKGPALNVAKGDFHCHSTASDGRLTPTQLIDLAAQRGVKVFALTDHDSTEGIAEARAAAAKHPGFTLIPGVELSTDIEENEVHVLGFFREVDDPELQAALARFRAGRYERGRRMTERLAALGLPISWQRVQEVAGDGSVGRPHVARAMVEAGHVQSIQEAFDRYIGRNGPAYVERLKMTPPEAVVTLRRFGAPPVLAHPRDIQDLEAVIAELMTAGLAGMEVYYKDYDEETIQRLAAICEKFGLLPLGGSDYHALQGPGEKLPGDIPLPDGAIEAFLRQELLWVPVTALR